MKHIKMFYYPESVQQAQEILRDESLKASIIAGGTSVALLEDKSIEALVDITRMELDYIWLEGGYLRIGATATATQIAQSPVVKMLGNGILSKAASLIASRPLRNMITIGGNIVQARVWSDFPTVLLALDAQVKVAGEDERIIPAEDFFKKQPRKHLARDEIVTEVIFPMTHEKSGAEFIKLGKTVGDFAIVTVGCYLEFEEKTCSLARIAVGSASPLPKRCKNGEKVLEGKELNKELINEASVEASKQVKTISNIWGSARYKTTVLQALIRRALYSCTGKAGIEL